MQVQVIGIIVLWIFLYGYMIIASIDFGAGFFASYGQYLRKEHILNGLISRYLSPVWEVTNVFFVFFFVGMVGFFPDVAYYFGTALLIPGSISLVLMAIRGSFYAFGNYGGKNKKFYTYIYGATGILIPASLSTALTISEGGFIDTERGGEIVFLAGKMATSTYSWSVVVLAIVSVLFISASFLCYYADRAEDTSALVLMRKFACFWSPPTILASIFVFITLYFHNPVHFTNTLDFAWMFFASFICFVIASFYLFKGRKYGTAFIYVMLQFFFAFFGYGASHMPYVLYPEINVFTSHSSSEMGIALVIVFVAGLCLLVPSLILLMRLFLFNAAYVKGTK